MDNANPCQTDRDAYRAALEQAESANGQARVAALNTAHSKGIAFFNCEELRSVAAARTGDDKIREVYTELAESAFSTLETIAIHFESLWNQQDSLGVGRSVAPSKTAYANMQRLAKAVMPEADWIAMRDRFRTIGLPTHGFDTEMSEKKIQTWEKIAAPTCGLFFLLFLLVIALVVPNPTPFQYIVFRSVLAIAGALFGGLMIGFLFVRLDFVNRMKIDAGAGFAIFVILFLVNPAKLVVTAPQTSPTGGTGGVTQPSSPEPGAAGDAPSREETRQDGTPSTGG